MPELLVKFLLSSFAIVTSLWIFFYFIPPPKIDESRKRRSLTVVIPAHNEQRYIQQTIYRVFEAQYTAPRQVIVVDDGSTDDTSKILSEIEEKHPNVLVLQTPHVGKAQAINAATSKATGEYLVVLDADSLVEEGALMKITAPLSDEQTAACAGIIRAVLNRNPITWFQDYEYILTSNVRRLYDNIKGTYLLPGFASFKTKLLKQSGGFKSDTLTEDFEVGLRLRKAGYTLRMTNATMYTNVPQTPLALARQRIRWGRGTIQTVRKHPQLLFEKKHFPVSILGVPLQLYWFLYGFINFPLSIYQFFDGWFTWFVSKGVGVSISSVKYLFNWISFWGVVDYSINVFSGAWEPTPIFPFLFTSFILGTTYSLLALFRFKPIKIRALIGFFFSFIHWSFITPFYTWPMAYEVFFGKPRDKINVWEK